MLNILSDHHHADLGWSLHLLAKRLNAKLYWPYGMDWYDKGYWKLYGDLSKKDPYKFLAKQYLEDLYYDGYTQETYCGCLDYPKPNLLTFEEFKDTPIDIIICSVNENENYFAKLKEFKPNAKFIRHSGNDLDTNTNHELYPNLLASSVSSYNAFRGQNKVLYHQEFDLNIFKYQPPKFFRNLYTFQNAIKFNEEAWEWYLRLQHNLKDFSFKSYGVANDDGKIYPKRTFVEKMNESSFVFQCKNYDGFGHILFNSMCLGRPLIVKKEYHEGRLIWPLLEERKTCLFLDDGIEQAIKMASEPERLREMSENARKRFNEVVSFDEDFETKLKPFFENLN